MPMDTRRGPGGQNREPYLPEVGTETVPVDLVELTSVAKARRGRGTMTILAVALVAVVAFAGIILSGQPLEPTPSPTLPGVAVASPTIAATPPPVVFSTASPRPSVRPSPTSTPPPPWEWVRTDLPGNRLRASGTWAVGGEFIVLAEQVDEIGSRTGWTLARWQSGNEWSLVPAPPAIGELYGGAVIDDRLWFLAKVVGVTPDDVRWELVSTSNAQDWESLGATEGLEKIDSPEFVARIGDTWVTAGMEFGEGSCCDGGDPQARLMWSRDGTSWTAADIPELPGKIGFGSTRAGRIAGSVVVAGLMQSGQEQAPFVLVSSNGRTWEVADVPFGTPAPSLLTGLACDGLGCVITTARPFCDCEPTDDPLAFVSSDGHEWSSHALTIPDSAVPDDGLRNLTSTGAGFLAMAGESGNALFSRTGEEWTAVRVMPLALSRFLVGLAVSGDMVMGVADTFNATPNGVWQGSLSLLEACAAESCPFN